MLEHRDILINSQEATPKLGDQEHLQVGDWQCQWGWHESVKWFSISSWQVKDKETGASMCDYSPIWEASTWTGFDHLLGDRYWVWAHVPNFLKLNIPREWSNLNRHHLDPQASSSIGSLSPGPFLSREFFSFVLIALNTAWSHFATVWPWL